jgi:8-oxo-dGTP diphosphatase
VQALREVERLKQKLNASVRAGTALELTRWNATHGEEVLLLRRTGAHGEGTWCPPGGWLDRGEHPRDGVIRELHEECGDKLYVHGLHFKGVTNDWYPDEGVHSVTLWYAAKWGSGTPRIAEPDKITEIGWFLRDKLPAPLFHGFDSYIEGDLLR